MKKTLSGILIIIGIAIHTLILCFFLEMTDICRVALFMGNYLMDFGISILLFYEKEKK